MKLGGPARFMTEIHSPEDAKSVIDHAREQKLPFFVLGGGSNVVARDEGFAGIVIRNHRITGFDVVAREPGKSYPQNRCWRKLGRCRQKNRRHEPQRHRSDECHSWRGRSCACPERHGAYGQGNCRYTDIT